MCIYEPDDIIQTDTELNLDFLTDITRPQEDFHFDTNQSILQSDNNQEEDT